MISGHSKPGLEMKMGEPFEGCWQHVDKLGGHITLSMVWGSQLKHHWHAHLLFNLHICGQKCISVERDLDAPEAGHSEP